MTSNAKYQKERAKEQAQRIARLALEIRWFCYPYNGHIQHKRLKLI